MRNSAQKHRRSGQLGAEQRNATSKRHVFAPQHSDESLHSAVSTRPPHQPALESPTEVSTVALAAPATVLAGETVPPPATASVAPVAAATPASPHRVIRTAERSDALSLSLCLSPPAHLPIPPRCDASPRRRVTALRRDDARRARAAMPRDAAAARGPDAASRHLATTPRCEATAVARGTVDCARTWTRAPRPACSGRDGRCGVPHCKAGR